MGHWVPGTAPQASSVSTSTLPVAYHEHHPLSSGCLDTQTVDWMEINGAPLNGGDEGRSPFEDRSGADEISLNGGGAPPSDADPGGGAPAPARAPSTTATAPARSLSMSMAAQQAAALAEVEARVEEEDAEQPHLFRRGEPDGDGGSGERTNVICPCVLPKCAGGGEWGRWATPFATEEG